MSEPREIKFRAWDIKTESMCVCGEARRFGIYTNEFLLRYYDPKYIMQFTGLKDKNGTDIYEGDILGRKGSKAYVVKWHDKECGWNISMPAVSIFEVIGNIHQHSDLLQ